MNSRLLNFNQVNQFPSSLVLMCNENSTARSRVVWSGRDVHFLSVCECLLVKDIRCEGTQLRKGDRASAWTDIQNSPCGYYVCGSKLTWGSMCFHLVLLPSGQNCFNHLYAQAEQKKTKKKLMRKHINNHIYLSEYSWGFLNIHLNIHFTERSNTFLLHWCTKLYFYFNQNTSFTGHVFQSEMSNSQTAIYFTYH